MIVYVDLLHHSESFPSVEETINYKLETINLISRYDFLIVL
jgi:hypothetical protein